MDRYIPVADILSKEPLTFLSAEEVQRWFNANGLFKNIDREGVFIRKSLFKEAKLRVVFGLQQSKEHVLEL